MKVICLQGIPPVERRNIPQEEFEELQAEALNAGPFKREYVAQMLYPVND